MCPETLRFFVSLQWGGIDVAQKKISARELVADIKGEMSDQNLMSKYDLSSQALQKLFQQLLDKELIQESDLARREEVVLNVDLVAEPAASVPPRHVASPETDVLRLFIEDAAAGDKEKVDALFDNLQACLNRGANVNTMTSKGFTALMIAAVWGRSDLVKLLLDRRADIDATNSFGVTALMTASTWGHMEVVKILLDKGANVHIQSKDGWTALRLALSKNHLEISELLKSRGAKDIQVRPVADIPAYYLSVFRRMESQDKTNIANLYALVFSVLWVFFKGMWKKGLVYLGAAIVIDILCELILHHNLGLLIAGIVLCFFGNWDYYLYRLHGDAFFNQRWWDGIRSGTFLSLTGLTPVIAAVPADGTVTQIPAQVERQDRKIGLGLGFFSLLFLIPIMLS